MVVGVKGSGDGKGLRVVEVEGENKGLRLRYEGGLEYEGVGVAGVVEVAGKGEVVRGRVEGRKGKYEVVVEDGELVGGAYKGVVVGYEEAEDRYDVRVGGEIGGGAVEGSGSILKGGKGYEGALGVKGVDVGWVKGVAGWLGVGVPEVGVEGGAVSGEFGVRGDYKELSWVAGGVNAEVRGSFGEVRVEGSGVGDSRGYEVKGVKVGYKGKELRVGGKGEYGEGWIGFEGELGYGGQGYEVGLRYEGAEVRVWGGYGLEGGVKRVAGGYEGSLKASGLPVEVGGGVIYGDIEAKGVYEGGALRVEGAGIGLRYEGEGEYPALRAEGVRYEKGELGIERLWVKGAGYGLTGSVRGTVGKTVPEGSSIPDLKFAGKFNGLVNPEESYTLDALYSGNAIDAKVDFTGLAFSRFAPGDLKGELRGKLKLKGALDLSALDLSALEAGSAIKWEKLPGLSLEASLDNGELKNQPLNFSLKADLTEGKLSFEAPSIDYAGHRLEKLAAQVSLQEGKAQFVGDYRKELGAQNLEATFVGDAEYRFEGDPAQPMANKVSAEFSGTLANIKFHETLVRSWTFSGSYGNDGFKVQGGGGDLHAALSPDGSFELSMENDFPILASVKGRMRDNLLSAKVEDIKIDLARLGAFLPIENLKVLDGDLTGSLTLDGSLADPEINGILSVQGGVVESTALLKDRFGPFSGYVNFSGRNVELAPAVIPLSTGAVEVSASGLLENWSLTDLGFKVVTRNDSVVVLSTKIAGITLIDTRAQLDIALSLDAGTVVAAGSVYLDRGQALIDPQGFGPEAQQPIDPNAPSFRIDASISFGKQLEVYLPDANLPIIRGFTLPGSLLSLKFDSGSGEYSLDGAIDLRSGYVFYYLRNFFIRSAKIEFAENTNKFNPLVTVDAELRESGREGLVRINLSTEKAPLSNLNPRLSSIPFYSETELIAIMSGGVLAVDTSKSLTIREAAIASSEFIPQLNIFKSFEQRVQKALGMDIVFIRSSFMQRWLLDLTKPSSEPNAEDPLARYLDQSELYMGRYLTDSAFFHASLRFREDPLVSSSRLRLDSEFGIEFDSPFGQINWSITPFMGEGSLVSGQELSLSWRLAY